MMKKNIPTIILTIVAVGIIGAIIFLESQKVNSGLSGIEQKSVELTNFSVETEDKAKKYELANEIVDPAGFINTDDLPITIQELIGKKVIMVDFWTYSCINCQRTLPYLNSWYDKYKDQGLEIIGVHTPEFEFEKDLNNVQNAVNQFDVKYPVVLDNDYGTWRNYRNRYWPHKFIIDIDGYIVYDHIGEGGYAETEKKIQELLAERMQVLNESGEISSDIVNPTNAEAVDVSKKRSPETYFGALRNVNLGNGKKGITGIQEFSVPSSPRTDILYLDGTWNVEDEFVQNQNGKTKIVFPYQGQKVFLVAGTTGDDVRLTILIDGQPVGNLAGSDVIDGQAIINDEKLYRLVEDPAGVGEHVLEIIVEDPGLQAFAFTFG